MFGYKHPDLTAVCLSAEQQQDGQSNTAAVLELGACRRAGFLPGYALAGCG